MTRGRSTQGRWVAPSPECLTPPFVSLELWVSCGACAQMPARGSGEKSPTPLLMSEESQLLALRPDLSLFF